VALPVSPQYLPSLNHLDIVRGAKKELEGASEVIKDTL
jgi:hypothetical protein